MEQKRISWAMDREGNFIDPAAQSAFEQWCKDEELRRTYHHVEDEEFE